ncbi:MAG: type sorting protein [Segetibacter sp.]|jgi:hypothetical protein|nr:type sorting protein [Segetibacter sp.]
MNKFYLIILFTGLTIYAQAQAPKSSDLNFGGSTNQPKMMRFYPNPATSVINFELQKPIQREFTLQVYNFVGKKMFELNNISQKIIIPLSEFYRGVYIFQIRDKSGRIVESGKFQVIK